MKKIFVIAGNFAEFCFYRNKLVGLMTNQDLDFRIQDIVYFDSPMAIKGYRDVWGYKVGSWQSLKNLSNLQQHLAVAGSSLDDFIETNFD